MRKRVAGRMNTYTSANAAMSIATRPLTTLVPGAPWYTQEEINKPKPVPRKKKRKPVPVIDTRILTWTKPKLKL